MKRRTVLALVGLAAVLQGCGCEDENGNGGPGKSITLLAPAGGEGIALGAQYEIVWESQLVGNVKIELSRDGNWEDGDGSDVETIATSLDASAGCYVWSVTGPVGEDCLVRISNQHDESVSDESHVVFSIVEVWYVDASASAGGDGLTWGTAFKKVQDGVAAASTGQELWVAEGTYYRQGTDTTLLALKEGVSLYGGFSGGEPEHTLRDWDTNATTLHGEDTVLHVVTGASDAVLDGFQVAHGYGFNEIGGGMYNVDASNLVIRNCTFSENWAINGGGMYNDGASLVIERCVFRANTANGGGGALWNHASATDITDCIFVGNVANVTAGGAIYNEEPTTTACLVNCVFAGNEAGWGGGAMCNGSETHVTITNSTGFGNDATNNGGAVYNSADADLTLTNCVLYGNTAASGAQIDDSGSGSATVTYSDIEGGWTGEGNIDEDPLFVDPDGPDDVLGTLDDDLRLQSTSPCIDTGDPGTTLTEDLDGNPRPSGSGYDMGAYESQ